MESKIQRSLIGTNIKDILVAVMATKLVCVGDSFSKPFSIFFSSMIKEIMKLKYEQE